MAGPQTIQRVPRGLLDWFGNKGTGDSPSELSNVLTPTADVGYLYLADLVTAQQWPTNTVNLPGFWATTGTNARVPAGENWLLFSITVQMSSALAAGEAYTFRPVISRNVFAYVQAAPTGSSVTAGVGDIPVAGWQFERPEILRPGDQVGLWAERVTAGAHQAFVQAFYARLLV